MKKSGTVAGQTDVLESVSVTAEEYREVMLHAGGVFDKMRSKMWWYKRCSGQPEAGHTLYYQHEGASPHIARANLQHWRRHGNMKGFTTEVVVQPVQSPDLNVNDLAFFSSLQTDTELVAKENVFDLSTAIVEVWEEYPSERIASVWRLLYASYKGIVEDDGSNAFSHHTGSRKAHNASAKAGDNHDRRLPVGKIVTAEATLEVPTCADGSE